MSKKDIFPNSKTADIVKVSNISIVILQSLLVFIKIYWSLQQLSESHVSAIYIFKLTIDWSIEEEMDREEEPQPIRRFVITEKAPTRTFSCYCGVNARLA